MPDLLMLLGVGAGAGIAGPFGNHATLGSKLVAHWKLNETSGQRHDSHSGAYHLGDNNTVGYTTGVLGNAANLVAANSEWLGDLTDSVFNPTAAFSWSGWFRGTTFPTNVAIIGKWLAAPQLCYRLVVNSSDQLQINFSTDGTASTLKAHSTVLSTATWYFFYFQCNGSQIGLSVNNDTLQTTSFSGYPYAGTDPLRFGRQASVYWNGDIDSVSFWNTTLSAGELTDLYNGGAGLDY